MWILSPMKKRIFISLLALLVISLLSCKSEEEKAQQACEKYIKEKVLHSKTIETVTFTTLSAEQIKKEFIDWKIYLYISFVNDSYARNQSICKKTPISNWPDIFKRPFYETRVAMQDIERFWIDTQNRLNDGSFGYYKIEYKDLDDDNTPIQIAEYLVIDNATKKVFELSKMFDNEKTYISSDLNTYDSSVEDDIATIQKIYNSLK